MTIGKQSTAQGERDRGRRVERIRIVLLELHERWGRCLPQDAVDSSPPRQQPEPPCHNCPRIQLHLTDSPANVNMRLTALLVGTARTRLMLHSKHYAAFSTRQPPRILVSPST